MIITKDDLRLAVVQAEPILFDKDSCIEKAERLIEEASQNGAEFVVFPELFVPGYPYGMTFGYTVGSRNDDGREDWKMYYDNSILKDGEEMKRIIDLALKNKIYISLGYSERDRVNASLYNSNIMISPEGKTYNHRKLKPTGSERVVWSDANKEFFPVMPTPWGPVGGLICWESYMPLARVALYQKGITIYISSNTNDNEEWQHTIRHIAIEGHCYFINANLFFTKSSYPETKSGKDEIKKLPDIVCRGGSSVIDPYGHAVTDTVWDKEAIIYANLDMQKVPKSRMEHDVCGHYQRDDLFQLSIRDE